MTSRNLLSGAALVAAALALLQVPAVPAAPTAVTATAPTVAAACANIGRDATTYDACANSIAAQIAADPAVKQQLTDALRNKQPDEVKSLVEKLGVPAVQLRGAQIALQGTHPKAGERIKDISVTISCCPLTITIVIRL